jgi:predicted nucleic acid-binding protein
VTADKIVADASAIAAIVFDEPRRAEMEARLIGAMLHAPALIDVEMASVCLKKLRDRAYPRNIVLRMYAAYDRLAMNTTDVDLPDVVLLAEKTGLSLYDACYAWLARKLNAELVTADIKLEKTFQALSSAY